MPLYRYKAISQKGEVLEGYKEAQSASEIVSFLKNNNYYPVSVKEDVDTSTRKVFFSKKVTKKDLSVFCRQFYTMLNAGISIINCLDILQRQVENKTLKKAILNLYEDVQKGMTLSEGMNKQKNVFPILLINMVEAGEVSGSLDVLMERMANHYEREYKIENKVRNALIYPAVLSVLSIAVVVFLIVVVMPTFVSMFQTSGSLLPTPTRILLDISSIIKEYWYLLISGLILLVFGFMYFLKTQIGRLFFDVLKISIPGIKKINIKIITSRFTRTLSTLLSSGIPLLEALEVVNRVVGNIVISEKLELVKEDTRRGIPISKAIRDINIFPPMVYSMIEIGEESGALDHILYKTADYYDEEIESTMEKMTTLLEPVLIVLIALVIGIIVLSMILPMFEMISTLGI
ncbi:MAG: type II secretion system F family protein [Tissierellia bacterium]|nr:type II secretion system F family protein [Tissierellia bacterium]